MYKKLFFLFFIMNTQYVFASNAQSMSPVRGSIKGLRKANSAKPAGAIASRTDEALAGQLAQDAADNARQGAACMAAYKKREEEADKAAQVFGCCAATCCCVSICCLYQCLKSH